MGQSSSRRRNNYPQIQPPPYPAPPPGPPPSYPYAPNYYSNPYPMHPPPPPPRPPHYNPNSYSHQFTLAYNNLVRFFDSLMGRTHYSYREYPPQYYGPNQGTGWWVVPPPPPPPPSSFSSSSAPNNPQSVPQYVEHERAKTVKNDVNVHRDTIRLEVDEHNPDQHLVSFVFDAMVDGR